jgi:hypothetical protein
LGFETQRTQEGQFRLLDWTYTRSGKCTLLFLVRTYAVDYNTYALQIVNGHMRDHTDVRYFVVYLMVNIWMYETHFGMLCK